MKIQMTEIVKQKEYICIISWVKVINLAVL